MLCEALFTLGVDVPALPEVLPSAAGVTATTLSMKVATIDVGAPVTYQARTWHNAAGQATFCGPVMRVNPGGTTEFTIKNERPPIADDPHHLDDTNVHTHGLHVPAEPLDGSG